MLGAPDVKEVWIGEEVEGKEPIMIIKHLAAETSPGLEADSMPKTKLPRRVRCSPWGVTCAVVTAPKKDPFFLRVGVLGRAHTSSKPLENTVNTVQNFKNCSEN